MKKNKQKDKKSNFLICIFFIIALVVITFFLRGTIYQMAVKYEDVGGRKAYEVKDKNLENYILENLPNDEMLDINITIDQVIELSQEMTSELLDYSFETKESDPQKIYTSGLANCIGYSALNAAIADYLIKRFELKGWEAKPKKGKLYLFGNNMHKNATDGWFKDHDFVVFKNKNTKDEIYVDPIAYEYFGAKYVEKYRK